MLFNEFTSFKAWCGERPSKLSRPIVVVWIANINAIDNDLSQIPLLNDELNRSKAYYNRQQAQRFKNSRRFLRRILADWNSIDPQQVNFEVTRFGQLFFADGPFFSISYASQRLAIALCEQSPVGIDTESHENELRHHRLLSTKGNDSIRGLVAKCGASRCWTQIEAVLKADGRGLAAGLENVWIENSAHSDEGFQRAKVMPSKEWSTQVASIDSPFADTYAAMALGNAEKRIELESIDVSDAHIGVCQYVCFE